jgi:hypothetical protein
MVEDVLCCHDFQDVQLLVGGYDNGMIMGHSL